MIDISTDRQMVEDGRIGDILASGIAPAIVRGDAALQESANASGGGMMWNVGARNASMFLGGKPTAKDYVQDGLVAMWDGIENVGWGVHDNNATTWKDLIGNLDATAINSPVFGDNHTDTSNGYWSLPSSVSEIVEMQSLTAEAAFQPSTSGETVENQGIVGIGNNRSLWLFIGNPPRHSNSSIVWQVRRSGSIRAWYNNGALGTAAHSCSVVANNSVCNTYLDSAICTITPNISAGSATSTDKFYIGMMSDTVVWHTFHGRTHSVRLYSRALTAEEIEHNYEIDKARFWIGGSA